MRWVRCLTATALPPAALDRSVWERGEHPRSSGHGQRCRRPGRSLRGCCLHRRSTTVRSARERDRTPHGTARSPSGRRVDVVGPATRRPARLLGLAPFGTGLGGGAVRAHPHGAGLPPTLPGIAPGQVVGSPPISVSDGTPRPSTGARSTSASPVAEGHLLRVLGVLEVAGEAPVLPAAVPLVGDGSAVDGEHIDAVHRRKMFEA